ncbi:uncharacterized protein BO97DRAFT_87612 [Aspergillus homomorphus CBS 101889]|uniref:Uncharacterized protein n=1 Tax=Aspergillus homomorphus (strain CBS 101889) TaxID=1450537 RepID=A0A395HVM3_ASPHC|nr:hypothetical protein BO97DRAFT_87612 [Aspergillus homomorphus CBS 101889]RAL11867.1 hypothetical protein BO97DRAFT_87612 [Aspergillus homomorphus CBS 101889]
MSIRTLSETDFDAPDLKRARPGTAHPSQTLCHDWMIVSGNCHYARDRAAFTSYRPVNVCLKHNVFNPTDELQVAGVGTVALRVLRTVDAAAAASSGMITMGEGTDGAVEHTLVLENVLHIPEAVCNGFNPLLYGSSMSCGAEAWTGADRGGVPLWVALPFAGGSRLVLAGHKEKQGVSELIAGRYYTLSLYVSAEEKAELGV